MTDKVWGVLLTDEGLAELEEALRPYLRTGPIGKYLYCQSVDLEPPFGRLIAEAVNQEIPFIGEIYIPLQHVKCAIAAAEFRQIGFTVQHDENG